jgi:hypothetical protein
VRFGRTITRIAERVAATVEVAKVRVFFFRLIFLPWLAAKIL